MLATSMGGKLRGEETGACTGTSSVVSKVATRDDSGVPTNELLPESGMLSVTVRVLDEPFTTPGCASARVATFAGEPCGKVVRGSSATLAGVDGKTAESSGAMGCDISSVSGDSSDPERDDAASPNCRAVPGNACVSGAC